MKLKDPTPSPMPPGGSPLRDQLPPAPRVTHELSMRVQHLVNEAARACVALDSALSDEQRADCEDLISHACDGLYSASGYLETIALRLRGVPAGYRAESVPDSAPDPDTLTLSRLQLTPKPPCSNCALLDPGELCARHSKQLGRPDPARNEASGETGKNT